MKRALITLLSLFFLLFPTVTRVSHAESSQPLDVYIRNLPETQHVKGSVSIEGPINNTRFLKKEGILVPPSRRSELSEMTFAGMVDTDGFTSITLSLQGETKSNSFTTGTIGVLLVPDEDPVLRSLREAKRVPFALETVAQLKSGESSFFDSAPALQRIAFPRYKMFLYNTVNKSVEANVYVYLSN